MARLRVASSTLSVCLILAGLAPAARGAPAFGTFLWPVRGPVIRPFQPPATPYGPGHRGIDIAVPFGTTVIAPAPASVSFAGFVAGSLFVTLDHGGGLETTYSWLSGLAVARGDPVAAGQPIASTGAGHPDVSVPHLHFGALLDDVYVDPMLLLGGGSVVGLIRLAPLGGPPATGEPLWAGGAPASGAAGAFRPAPAWVSRRALARPGAPSGGPLGTAHRAR